MFMSRLKKEEYLETTKNDYIEDMWRKRYMGKPIYFEYAVQGLLLVLKNIETKNNENDKERIKYINDIENKLFNYGEIYFSDIAYGLMLIMKNQE